MRALPLVCLLGCGRLGFEPVSIGDDGTDGASAATANIMFVTADTHDGNLGGLEGADAICNTAAINAGLPENEYVAWLSAGTIGARSRVGTARGWVRTDGRPFAESVAGLLVNEIFYPPSLDENGAEVRQNVMTGTNSNFDGDGFDCDGWTTNLNFGLMSFGQTITTTVQWTDAYEAPCGASYQLYCFGTRYETSVAPPQPSGRLAFVSTGNFTPGGGRDTADGLCAQEARAAQLPGEFLALMATSTESAFARFDLGGASWMRLDGVQIAASNADLAAGLWLSSLDLTARRERTSATVLTGAARPNQPGTDAQTCGGSWLRSTASDSYVVGGAALTGIETFASALGPFDCSTSGRVFCFQR